MIEIKKYYKNIDFIRIFACIAILLYHFNLLKGGYLAVCTFFVLSSYLSCISAFRKKKFSLLSYYANRLLKLYLPLVIVVFITLFVISLFPNISWLNLKPETTSVLFGYNNFWQLDANLDYFARHVNSPFMHLWYIAILLQFDLIFPFIYLILRKIGDKVHKMIPCMITLILSIIGVIYFYQFSMTQNIMITYYNTFTRIFSLLFGLSLGFIHSYYGSMVPKCFKKKPIRNIIFYLYIFILIGLFIFIDANSPFFALSMIAVTLITCRLIDYGTILIQEHLSVPDKIINSFSSASYEIYLFQYPVIFLFQYINIEQNLKLPIMILLILILSYLLYFCITFKKKKKFKILQYIMFIIVLGISSFGAYHYYLAEDHTEEMKQLEEQLAQNEKIIQQKQEEYASQMKQEEVDWQATLKNLENGENELKNVVANLPIVGIGDSVMLGAVDNLYQTFSNGYFDAKISRTAWVVNDIILDLKNRNILGDPVILNLGANGDCTEECKREIMTSCGNRQVFWITITNDSDVRVNDDLFALANKYNNLHIIDWNSISSGHPEYFVADGIHLTEAGKKVYTQVIYDAIYEIYLEEFNAKKESILKQHEDEMKTKISFYGNDILLNAFDYVHGDFNDAKFMINKAFNYKTLKEEIEKSIQDNSLTHRIVFTFDHTITFSEKEYHDLIELCKGHEIYILSTDEQSIHHLRNINDENVTVINFYQEIKDHSNYLMVDEIHLTEEGNQAFSKMLNDVLKETIHV